MVKFQAWAEKNPKIILFIAAMGVACAIESYVTVAKWHDGLVQIEASEFYGG